MTTTRNLISIARSAMACEFSLLFPAADGHAVEKGFAALDEVERLEARLSVYRDDSDLAYLNRTACDRPVAVDEELFQFVDYTCRLSAGTGGAFDCATGALIRAWGFFRGPKRVPSADELSDALALSGSWRVRLDPRERSVSFLRRGIELNPGAVGKGFAIDRALERVTAEWGRRPVLMQGGKSSVRAIGAPPGEPAGWPVAIGDPFQPGRLLATILLRDRALGTSAADQQFFSSRGKRYGHILDPRTGMPADVLASASALAPTATEADALSTAFFVMGVDGTREYCRRHRNLAAVLVTRPAFATSQRVWQLSTPADGVDARPATPQVIAIGLSPEEVTFL